MTEERAREALEAQGFNNPGPKLIEHVTDAIAREEEDIPAGERTHGFDPAELLADTPELLDRTEGPLTNPGTELSYVLADVLNRAKRYCSMSDTAANTPGNQPIRMGVTDRDARRLHWGERGYVR